MSGLAMGSIISILIEMLPRIIACFNPTDGQEAQRYVMRRYNQEQASNSNRGYKKDLVKAMTRQALAAARKNKQNITFEQASEIALATLDSIRLGNTSQASIMISENHDFVLI
jgi:hypothetical protein